MANMKIYAIEIKNAWLLSTKPDADSYSTEPLVNFYLDGKHPKQSWDKRWVIVDTLPNKIEKRLPPKRVNYRYELRNPEMVSDKIPLVLERETVADKDGYEWWWKSEYKHLESLYKLESDELPEEFELVDFSVETIIQAPDVTVPEKTKYFIPGKYSSPNRIEGREIFGSTLPKTLLAELLVPPVLQHTVPCKMSSKTVFNVIRGHVQRNFDPTTMEITSNYNFHFVVVKLVAIEPIVNKREILTSRGRSYKQKRYRSRTVKNRSIEILNIVPMRRGNSYSGSWVPDPIEAESEADLKDKVDALLDKIMYLLGTSLKDCPKCGGMGIVEYDSHVITKDKLV